MTIEHSLFMLATPLWIYAAWGMFRGLGDRFDIRAAALAPVVVIAVCARFLPDHAWHMSVQQLVEAHHNDRSHTRTLHIRYGDKRGTIIIPSFTKPGSLGFVRQAPERDARRGQQKQVPASIP